MFSLMIISQLNCMKEDPRKNDGSFDTRQNEEDKNELMRLIEHLTRDRIYIDEAPYTQEYLEPHPTAQSIEEIAGDMWDLIAKLNGNKMPEDIYGRNIYMTGHYLSRAEYKARKRKLTELSVQGNTNISGAKRDDVTTEESNSDESDDSESKYLVKKKRPKKKLKQLADITTFPCLRVVEGIQCLYSAPQETYFARHDKAHHGKGYVCSKCKLECGSAGGRKQHKKTCKSSSNQPRQNMVEQKTMMRKFRVTSKMGHAK